MFSGSIIILMILSQAISYTAIPVGSNLPSSDYLQVKTHYQITLAIRERKLASRILRLPSVWQRPFTFAPATRARALDLVHVFLLLTCLAKMSDWGARQEKEVSAKRPFSPS